MNTDTKLFAGCSKVSIKAEECFRPMLNYVLVSKEAYDELLQQAPDSIKHSMEIAFVPVVTLGEKQDCEPSAVSLGEDKAYMEEQHHKKGDKKVKRKTPLQRRMQRPCATLTYNLLKTGEDKEKLLMEYERRMEKFLSYLEEADCIDEKEEEFWMKLFSGEEVDVRVKIHWLGTAGGLVYLLKLMKKEKLFSTPKMWSFWDWVAQRFVFANEEPVSENLRKNHETENTKLRKKIRQAVDALVYR